MASLKKKLSYLTSFTQPTLVKAMRNMKKRSFIRLAADSNDARRWKIYLTPEGQDFKGKFLPKVTKD